ncbi:hypothetical protein K8R20_02720 [bacterium]|nr:hypothetical protein [bacterium]
MSETNNPIEQDFGFEPKARDSHDIKTLPGGVKNALLVATLVGAFGGACASRESSAAPVEPTSAEQNDPTLVPQKPLSTPESTEVPSTMMPTEVVEEVETFSSITEGLTVVPGTREEVDKAFVVTEDTQVFRVPITENEGRDDLDVSKGVVVGDIEKGVVVPVGQTLRMVDKDGKEIRLALVKDVVGESAVHVVVIQDKEGNVFATEREDGPIATGVITNIGEYPTEDVETLSKVFEQFVNFQRTGGEFKNGAEYTSDFIFGIGKYTEEETDFLLEMVKRLNSSDSEEEKFISKVKGFVNVDISKSENGDIWFTLSESNELREIDLSFLQGGSTQVVESSVGMSEEEQVMAESIVDLQGLGVFLEDLEQRDLVLEYLEFQEVLNGCNGDVEELRNANTGNEAWDRVFGILADHVEGGGKVNSIALAFVMREAFPEVGFPRIQDKIRDDFTEVLGDISYSYYDYVALFAGTFNRNQMMRGPTAFGGTFRTGPTNLIYPFLAPGDILLPPREEVRNNPQIGKLQAILGKIVAKDGTIFLLVTEIDEDGVMRMFVSKDNEDNLVSNTGSRDIIRGVWIAPELPPGAEPMDPPPKADE